MADRLLTRKAMLQSSLVSALAAAAPFSLAERSPGAEINLDDLKAFTRLTGLTFTDDELKEVLSDVKDWLKGYETLRALPIPTEVEPPTIFTPKSHRKSSGKSGISCRTTGVGDLRRPGSNEDLAFMTVRQLSHLIQTRQVTSAELTELYLDRLRKYGDKLQCVVTLMPEQAMERAKRADEEIAAGKSRGPLHGIPCGIKDLFAMRGAPTTWGAAPYKDQVFEYDCTVVERLRAAGAIILAKLTLGALAQGDKWFGRMTKNPWNPKEGSSGSSAGSAAATSAGLVAFAVGTETLGSIMSPSNR